MVLATQDPDLAQHCLYLILKQRKSKEQLLAVDGIEQKFSLCHGRSSLPMSDPYFGRAYIGKLDRKMSFFLSDFYFLVFGLTEYKKDNHTK